MEEMETGTGIRRQSRLECDPQRAWQALTRPSELSAWLGGEVEVDLRPGGELVVTEPDGEVRTGFVERVEPLETVVFWWRGPESEDSSRVEISVGPDPDGDEDAESCLVTVVESLPMLILERELAVISASDGGQGPTASAAGPVALIA